MKADTKPLLTMVGLLAVFSWLLVAGCDLFS